jgi:hypothetical protein
MARAIKRENHDTQQSEGLKLHLIKALTCRLWREMREALTDSLNP